MDYYERQSLIFIIQRKIFGANVQPATVVSVRQYALVDGAWTQKDRKNKHYLVNFNINSKSQIPLASYLQSNELTITDDLVKTFVANVFSFPLEALTPVFVFNTEQKKLYRVPYCIENT